MISAAELAELRANDAAFKAQRSQPPHLRAPTPRPRPRSGGLGRVLTGIPSGRPAVMGPRRGSIWAKRANGC